MWSSLVLALPLLSTLVSAAVTPTSPESATVVRAGQPLTAMWAADTTGQWTSMTVQLMTGDNLHMVPLTTLATGIDGTKLTTASWTTPQVQPYSKIYFLQFTAGGDVSTAQWTTRFTIASADGSTTPPTNTTTYDASQGPVQWGTGVLISGGSGASPSGNSTASNSSAAGSAGSGGPATISVSQSTTLAMSTTSSSTSSRSTTSASSTTAAAASATSRAAAGRLEVGGLIGVLAGLVGVALM